MARCERRSPWRACETRRLGTPMGSWAPCVVCRGARRPSGECARRVDGAGAAPSAESTAKVPGSSVRAFGSERAQRLETRVDVVGRVIVRALIEWQATGRAQAGAVGAVEWGDRFGERDRITDRGRKVELVVVGQAKGLGLVVAGHGLAGREVE